MIHLGVSGLMWCRDLTAISDLLRRPLYMVTSDELGLSPSEVEHDLQRALDQLEYLSAVLLIDEGYIFLEARSGHDLMRNALVSTFLRLLGYYKGVMFSTTNRLDAFDMVISSRIHMTLGMTQLSQGVQGAGVEKYGRGEQSRARLPYPGQKGS